MSVDCVEVIGMYLPGMCQAYCTVSDWLVALYVSFVIYHFIRCMWIEQERNIRSV